MSSKALHLKPSDKRHSLEWSTRGLSRLSRGAVLRRGAIRERNKRIRRERIKSLVQRIRTGKSHFVLIHLKQTERICQFRKMTGHGQVGVTRARITVSVPRIAVIPVVKPSSRNVVLSRTYRRCVWAGDSRGSYREWIRPNKQ